MADLKKRIQFLREERSALRTSVGTRLIARYWSKPVRSDLRTFPMTPGNDLWIAVGNVIGTQTICWTFQTTNLCAHRNDLQEARSKARAKEQHKQRPMTRTLLPSPRAGMASIFRCDHHRGVSVMPFEHSASSACIFTQSKTSHVQIRQHKFSSPDTRGYRWISTYEMLIRAVELRHQLLAYTPHVEEEFSDCTVARDFDIARHPVKILWPFYRVVKPHKDESDGNSPFKCSDRFGLCLRSLDDIKAGGRRSE